VPDAKSLSSPYLYRRLDSGFMDIVIVGAGNIAHTFGQLLQIKGHHILQVVGRNEDHARSLAGLLNTKFTTDTGEIDTDADIYLLAVNDQSLPVLNRQLRLGKRVVAHTAAAVPMEAISAISKNTGVIYPLQTIRKEIKTSYDIPVLLEANNAETLKRLQTVAEAIGEQITVLSSAERLKLHLAATFCNNFMNHLAAMIKEYCERESLDFRLLHPLLGETFERIIKSDPRKIQTGPAARKDQITMEAHRQLMRTYPQMRKIYDLLSESIYQYYNDQEPE
jgi:predicted dinucleotide-binding enzyme